MPRYRYEDRPTCSIKNCREKCHLQNDYYDGTANYRTVCGKHHRERSAKKRGLSVAQWTNSWHPYRKYRKTYCENIDGRLGYKCTTTIMIEAQLDVDHINGDPTDNRPKNLQTLCQCCHKYKTIVYGDYATPGRRSLGVTY